MKTLPEKFVPKNWGFERWVCNNNLYCGKELFIANGKRFSIHFHRIKTETFLCQSGSANLLYREVPRYFPLDNPTECERFAQYMRLETLVAGDVFHVWPWLAHQIIAVADTTIIEFSTHHEDSDSYRIIKGD
jgi:hypothetical protein